MLNRGASASARSAGPVATVTRARRTGFGMPAGRGSPSAARRTLRARARSRLPGDGRLRRGRPGPYVPGALPARPYRLGADPDVALLRTAEGNSRAAPRARGLVERHRTGGRLRRCRGAGVGRPWARRAADVLFRQGPTTIENPEREGV
jgi:hypothetical protein